MGASLLGLPKSIYCSTISLAVLFVILLIARIFTRKNPLVLYVRPSNKVYIIHDSDDLAIKQYCLSIKVHVYAYCFSSTQEAKTSLDCENIPLGWSVIFLFQGAGATREKNCLAYEYYIVNQDM